MQPTNSSSTIAFTALIIGLDNSGKTTFIQSFKNNPNEVEIIPTTGFNIEKVMYPKLSKPILIFDCSGQGRHRENWRTFYHDVDSVIFVIDSSDSKRLSLTKMNIQNFLNHPEIENRDIPIVFALNKCDLEDTIDKEELKNYLGLDKIKKLKSKKIIVKETSGFKGENINECFDWIYSNLNSTNILS